jgi:hypothetical protein
MPKLACEEVEEEKQSFDPLSPLRSFVVSLFRLCHLSVVLPSPLCPSQYTFLLVCLSFASPSHRSADCIEKLQVRTCWTCQLLPRSTSSLQRLGASSHSLTSTVATPSAVPASSISLGCTSTSSSSASSLSSTHSCLSPSPSTSPAPPCLHYQHPHPLAHQHLSSPLRPSSSRLGSLPPRLSLSTRWIANSLQTQTGRTWTRTRSSRGTSATSCGGGR